MISEKKRVGRPATGKGTPVLVRLDADLLARLDELRTASEPILNRPEAIRMIMKMRLESADARKERRVADLLAKSRRRHGLPA
jgi:metal-responsive CopG/Arc/MetJ family transcriptional regulator